MTADSTAEKAWEEHFARIAPYSSEPGKYPDAEGRGQMYKLGFMAGRASRDAEVAELRANWENDCGHLERAENTVESLREQLAEANASIDEIENRLRADGYGDEDRVRIALLHIDAIHEGKARPLAHVEQRLAEAQATIAKVRVYAEDRAFHAKGHLNTVNSGRIASDLLAILSAPSSTGGNDHE